MGGKARGTVRVRGRSAGEGKGRKATGGKGREATGGSGRPAGPRERRRRRAGEGNGRLPRRAAFDEKVRRLRSRIAGLPGAVVAFSGGVDSSVLAALAARELGRRCLAVTLVSPTLPTRCRARAGEVARAIGIAHRELAHDELADAAFVGNPKDRCYYCKAGMAAALAPLARSRGWVLLEGTNVSELAGHRPGFRAVQEAGALSPLAEASLTKAEVRGLARLLGLPNALDPPTACLASRIPHGEEITAEKLARVDAAEDYLVSLGVGQVRVRHRGGEAPVACIEVEPQDFATVMKARAKIIERFTALGFRHVALDLQGYRTGSMN